MPRVYEYKTQFRRDGKPNHRCTKCGNEIEPGQRRYEWSFRYGGTYRRHVSCGRPRQSELTQSKMSQVYAATEAVEDLLSTDFDENDLRFALEAAAEEIRLVASEYEEAAEHFGQSGENQERYEALDAFADELEGVDVTEYEEDGQSRDDWRESIREDVESALSQCPY